MTPITFFEIPRGSWSRSGQFFTIDPAILINDTASLHLVHTERGPALRDQNAPNGAAVHFPLTPGAVYDLKGRQFAKFRAACIASGAVITDSQSGGTEAPTA